MRKEDWIILGIVVLILVLMVTVFLVTSSGDPLIKAQQYRTKTMRETVMPMVSKTQERDDYDKAGSGDQAPPLAENQRIIVSESIMNEVAQNALNAPVPEDGLQEIKNFLQTSPDAEAVSDAQAAAALLHMRTSPPDPEAAKAAARQAMDTARSQEQRDRAAHVQLIVLREGGEMEVALQTARAYAANRTEPTESSLQSGLLQAAMELESDDLDSAEKTFRRVLSEAQLLQQNGHTNASGAYRLAGLKLARLLRETGRNEEADQLAKEAAAIPEP